MAVTARVKPSLPTLKECSSPLLPCKGSWVRAPVEADSGVARRNRSQFSGYQKEILAGTGVLAVGLWLRFDSRTSGLFEGQDSPSVFLTGVYILVAAGALMMVVGFLGCCGAIKESPCMLGMFFFFLLIIFAIEVAAGIWGLSNKDRVVEDVTEFYKQTYTNYKDTRQDALKETLRLIHFGLDCCGPTGTVIDAAKDICPKKEGLEVLITTSCPAAIDEIFNNKLHIMGGVGIGIGIIMIFGMIFSMMLCCAIKKSRDFV